jgi:hypothetical protein
MQVNDLFLGYGFEKASFTASAVADNIPPEIISPIAYDAGIKFKDSEEGHITISLNGKCTDGTLNIPGDVEVQKVEIGKVRRPLGSQISLMDAFTTAFMFSGKTIPIDKKFIFDNIFKINGELFAPEISVNKIKLQTIMPMLKRKIEESFKKIGGGIDKANLPINIPGFNIQDFGNKTDDIQPTKDDGIFDQIPRINENGEEVPTAEPRKKSKLEKNMEKVKTIIDIFNLAK